ncbi:MAG: acyl-[acyl-carrier-protein] thioesterase [Lachnospiraceae bacterium]|nr:acyl-[acyl-carrier-protein] thioesterase [Lachnospiraceae bacterium]
MYSFDSCIRYSEVGPDRKAKLSSVIDYFQDCSTFQSEYLGNGLEILEREKRAWLVSSWQVEIVRLPKITEKVKVSTWPYDFKAFYGYRNFVMTDESGTDIAYAASIWINYDAASGRPMKIEPKHVEKYPKEAPYPMEYAPRKIELPSGGEKLEPFKVHAAYIDNNKHVNNAVYMKLAECYLPEGASVTGFRIDYRAQARLGDVMHPLVSNGEEDTTVVFADDEGKPYAIIKFYFGSRRD